MPKRRMRRRYRRKRLGRRGLKMKLRKFINQGYQLYKLRPQPVSLFANISGEIKLRGCLTNPTRSYDGTGTVNDWTALTDLFDSYRVCGIKIKYFPRAPNDEQTNFAYAPVYAIVDYDHVDTTNPLATIQDAIQYERLRTFNLYKPWKWYIRVPKYNAPLDSAGATVGVLKSGFLDFNDLPAQGVWAFFGTQFTGGSEYGYLYVTYYVVAKNRR